MQRCVGKSLARRPIPPEVVITIRSIEAAHISLSCTPLNIVNLDALLFYKNWKVSLGGLYNLGHYKGGTLLR